MKTKDLFDGLGTKYTAVELDEMDDGADWQDELLAQTGQRTVPNVFINGQHLGGNDDTEHPDDLLNCLLNSPQLRMLGGATPTHKSSPFLGGAPSAASTSATLSDVLQVDQTFRRVGSWCEVAPMLA